MSARQLLPRCRRGFRVVKQEQQLVEFSEAGSYAVPASS